MPDPKQIKRRGGPAFLNFRAEVAAAKGNESLIEKACVGEEAAPTIALRRSRP